MATLGVMIEGQEGLTVERWERLIQATERLGFESLWRSDHLASGMAGDRETLALEPSLAMVARESQRIQFGQLVSPITFRHPVTLAQAAVTLDRLSGGRYKLGLGAGWMEREHAAFGFQLPSASERLQRLEEAIRVIKLLQTGETVSFDGQYYQLRNAQMRPTPTRPGGVPLVIGGRRGRGFSIVARYADEWNVVGGLTIAAYQAMGHELRRFCRDAKRDRRDIRRSMMTAYLIGRDQDELRWRGRRMQVLLPSLQSISLNDLPTQLRESGWFVGTPGQIVEQINAWQAAGVERFMLQTFDQEDQDALELIAAEVLPRVSAAAEHYATSHLELGDSQDQGANASG